MNISKEISMAWYIWLLLSFAILGCGFVIGMIVESMLRKNECPLNDDNLPCERCLKCNLYNEVD
jgi:hypothetical protein